MTISLSKTKSLIATLDADDYNMLLVQNKEIKICYNYLNYIYFSVIKTEDTRTEEHKEYKENGDFVLKLFENKIPSQDFYPMVITLPENNKNIDCLVIKCPGKKIFKIGINKKFKVESIVQKPVSLTPNYENIRIFLKKKSRM